VDIRTVRRVLDRLAEAGVLETFGTGDHTHYRVRKA
jgi:Fe2+ or Zn2+ uptake regulation protein